MISKFIKEPEITQVRVNRTHYLTCQAPDFPECTAIVECPFSDDPLRRLHRWMELPDGS